MTRGNTGNMSVYIAASIVVAGVGVVGVLEEPELRTMSLRRM